MPPPSCCKSVVSFVVRCIQKIMLVAQNIEISGAAKQVVLAEDNIDEEILCNRPKNRKKYSFGSKYQKIVLILVKSLGLKGKYG